MSSLTVAFVQFAPRFGEKEENFWNGRPLQQAGARGDAVITADIRPAETRDKSFNPINDVLRDRRPEHYGPIVSRER